MFEWLILNTDLSSTPLGSSSFVWLIRMGLRVSGRRWKRGYIGTYHQMSVKHRHRYANEFASRHNIHVLDTIDQMRAVVNNLKGKRMKYKGSGIGD